MSARSLAGTLGRNAETEIMNKLLEIIWPIIAVIVALLIYVGVFLILCVPGMLIIRLYNRFLREKYGHNDVAIAIIRSLFMAPVPIIGHGIIVVPLPFGLLAYIYDIGIKLGTQWYVLSSLATFFGSLGVSIVRYHKAKKAICGG